MWVKIEGITTEDDALLSIAMGADALGFVFAPSKRQVTVSVASDIVKRLPNDVFSSSTTTFATTSAPITVAWNT